jgi:hypothetical protein
MLIAEMHDPCIELMRMIAEGQMKGARGTHPSTADQF